MSNIMMTYWHNLLFKKKKESPIWNQSVSLPAPDPSSDQRHQKSLGFWTVFLLTLEIWSQGCCCLPNIPLGAGMGLVLPNTSSFLLSRLYLALVVKASFQGQENFTNVASLSRIYHGKNLYLLSFHAGNCGAVAPTLQPAPPPTPAPVPCTGRAPGSRASFFPENGRKKSSMTAVFMKS